MWPAARRDQDAFGAKLGPVCQPHLLRADDGRARPEDGDLVIVERLAIESLEPVDLGQHIVAQNVPVEPALGHVPAELARVVDILGKMRAIDEQLLGHASTDDASAADPILLRHRDARAVRGRDARRAHAARTGADDEKIIVEIAHGLPLEWTGMCSRPPSMWLRAGSLPIEFCVYAYSPSAACISACVAGSKVIVPSASPFAISLPSSTPNWSKGLMPSSTALAKTRCS